MRTVYNLLHFSQKTPKHLLLSIPDTVPDVDKVEGIVLSISSKDSSQSFALSSAEIEDFIYALSYAQSALLLRRILSINAKYNIINKK